MGTVSGSLGTAGERDAAARNTEMPLRERVYKGAGKPRLAVGQAVGRGFWCVRAGRRGAGESEKRSAGLMAMAAPQNRWRYAALCSCGTQQAVQQRTRPARDSLGLAAKSSGDLAAHETKATSDQQRILPEA